jgi:opacity protein-like surface antigen
MPMTDIARFICLSTAVVALVLSASAAGAQGSDTDMRESRGYVSLGVGSLDLGALNDRLVGNGYPSSPEHLFAIGGGGHGIGRRWVIGGEGQGLIGRTKDATRGGRNDESTVTAGYGLFNLGYAVVKQRDLHVYPLVGIGGGGVSLRINERSSPTFDEVLADPGRGVNVSTGGLLVQVGVGADKLFVRRRGERDGRPYESGLVLGVRAGYILMPYQADWAIDGTRVPGGPSADIAGPYVHVIVGGGGKTARR